MNHRDAAIYALLTDDGQLDHETLRLCGQVIRRASAEGANDGQLQAYLAYRKRVANPGVDKDRAQRVMTAMRTNRWGLRDVVWAVRSRARAARQSRMEEPASDARAAFYDQIATANAMIPANKRGRGSSSGGRRRRDKPTPRRQPPGTLV